MKIYNGTMTISNTNYTTSMLINPDIPAVGAVATSINSPITVAGPTAEISKGEGSLSKTPSLPPLKKSRSSKTQTVDIGTPPVMLIDQNGTPDVNSSDNKPSAKKNLLTEFNMTARKGGKKTSRPNLEKNN
ncbi:hypothetical protein PIB30_022584 [Stylosanthes scabra]|uniref:Uncharacterized protein n=1 Tax=Stylosanthes scabra TaxID=79078 RepID=A0ABU6Z9N2_9FABA|nr:hypothetical protein [Stylosanthes scabra]